MREYAPELPDGEDAAAAGGRRPHAEEGAVGEAAPGGRRDVHIAAHLPQDLGPQRHQAPVLDRDPGAHRHLPPDLLRINRPAWSDVPTAGGGSSNPWSHGWVIATAVSSLPLSVWSVASAWHLCHRSSSCLFI